MKVYATLVATDSYVAGAMALAQSLYNTRTTHPIVCLCTPNVSPDSVALLQRLYSKLHQVAVLDSKDAAKLEMMNRPELGITLTKLHLWSLTEYSKIVYLDADAIVIKNIDELMGIEEAFAAAPDCGWPDLFNSGMMVLTPDVGTYQELLEAITRGSFDGGDQGLLNEYFTDWHRLPFTYNVTPTAVYSYKPAVAARRHEVKVVHFAGGTKPWTQGKAEGSIVEEWEQKWWDVYDKTQMYNPSSTSRAKIKEEIREEVRESRREEFDPRVASDNPTVLFHQYHHNISYNDRDWEKKRTQVDYDPSVVRELPPIVTEYLDIPEESTSYNDSIQMSAKEDTLSSRQSPIKETTESKPSTSLSGDHLVEILQPTPLLERKHIFALFNTQKFDDFTGVSMFNDDAWRSTPQIKSTADALDQVAQVDQVDHGSKIQNTIIEKEENTRETQRYKWPEFAHLHLKAMEDVLAREEPSHGLWNSKNTPPYASASYSPDKGCIKWMKEMLEDFRSCNYPEKVQKWEREIQLLEERRSREK